MSRYQLVQVIVPKGTRIHYQAVGSGETLCGRPSLYPVSESPNPGWWNAQAVCGVCYSLVLQETDDE
jgi:hypothetical protein